MGSPSEAFWRGESGLEERARLRDEARRELEIAGGARTLHDAVVLRAVLEQERDLLLSYF